MNAVQPNASAGYGFTLVEIMIVVAIIGLLATMAFPNFVRSRTTAQKNACIANLKEIECAKEQWALENKATGGDAVDTSSTGVPSYMKNSVLPECPAGGSYTLNVIGTQAGCSLADLGHTD